MPELPSGTVTFLFTDIEGSTALWERDRAAMADCGRAPPRPACARPSRPMAASTSRPSAMRSRPPSPRLPHAVAAALAAQRALLAEDWGAIGPLRVRMALHAGEADPGRARRLPRGRRSTAWPGCWPAGHGGQILLSQAVQQLTRGRPACRRRAARSGRAPAARPAGAGAGLPAAAPGPAGRVPAAQIAGGPTAQPALPADALPGPGAGGGRGRRAAAPP